MTDAGRAHELIDFNSLYQRYAADVRRFVLFMSGNRSAADDITSETFIRLWNARSRVDFRTVKAYLFAIARNLYLQQRRYSSRQQELDDRAPGDQPDPEKQTQVRSELEAVMSALQELPEVDRAAVLMRAEDDLSYEEIAAALGITPGAARVKVHRARLLLAKRTGVRVPTGTKGYSS